ncbi:MAG: hypothetical protein AB1714_16485 [Acidobacteriota bacterium]
MDNTACLIPIPTGLPDFPWAGRVVEVKVAETVEFRFVKSVAAEPWLLGRAYRPVRVARHQTKNRAEARNTFSPRWYVANSKELLEALWAVCPKYPTELLSYLLCVGGLSFEFEPIDQGRIGTSPAWVQDPEHQTCDKCKKRMYLVLQLPGTVISKKAFHRGTFFFFGCRAHPNETKTLAQFT